MSCSVKISSAKNWGGSQRKINSLTEESFPLPLPSSRAPPRPAVKSSIAAKKGEDTTKLLKYIDDNVIGKTSTFFGPFGRRKVVYCDYTASGRSLQFLEEYITKEVLPCLGDTRASTSICSLQSSLFRHEARDIVRHAVGASEQDAVLFTGHGTASALRALLRHLDLTKPTVVFVGPFEHHANLRPWREHGIKITRIAETKEGFLDLNDLDRQLAKERPTGAQLVGCFSAASCITGVLADDVATTLLLHQYGALSIWDYTSAAPYVQMDMNPHLPGVGETAVHKDAIIFAGHKFIGGAQTPGVLVTKRNLLGIDSNIDDMRDSHRYLQDPELREESGTAAIVETIRCGLAVQLKENVTPQAIMARQDKITKQVLAHVRTIPELILLGSSSHNVKRLSIFSFMVRHPRGTFLHHNFVCAVLNDVFGVQARGGCACTGRYAHELMGIDEKLAKDYDSILQPNSANEETSMEMLRPGFARLSFPFFMSEAEVAFVLEALKMVATEGWKLLPQYVLNPDTGEWRHHTNSVFKDRKWLGSIRYTDGKMIASERRVSGPGVFPQSYSDCLQTARNIFNRARKMAQRYPLQIDQSLVFNSETKLLRWFILPCEAQDLLLGNSQNVKQDVPFNPVTYRLRYSAFDLPSNTLLLTNGIRRLNSDIPRTGNTPVTPNSPRHHSLPVLTRPIPQILDQKKHSYGQNVHLRSAVSPPLMAQLSLPEYATNSCGQRSPSTCPSSPMPVRFAVGEAVTPTILGTPAVAQLIAGDQNSPGRARCNSLGSSSTSPPILSPQIMASLGINNSRHRHCSCSSQTDLNSLEFDNGSPTHSLTQINYLSNSDVRVGRSSPVSNLSQSSEDLHAYLKEVTKELATEIKSEIREVISQVDDVLSETNTTENTPQHHSRAHSLNHSEDKHDSFSASDIAEYLMEFSKEMASEVKSEIRCMVNAVDGLHRFSPDTSSSDKSSNGCGSPERILPKSVGAVSKLSELSQESKMSSECSSDETVIYVIKQEAGVKTDDEDHSGTEIDIKTLPKIYSTINSVSSQDSGINLSFHENDKSVGDTELRRSSSAESYSNGCRRLRINGKNSKQKRTVNDLSEDEEIVSECSTTTGLEEARLNPEKPSEDGTPQWLCPPKNIWKPSVEAMQEFDMIRDGDKVMVCLSGGKDSLSLLHTLHQYQFYVRSKGVNFEIGAATVDSKTYDPIQLMTYLKTLGVPYFYEEQSVIEDEVGRSACSFCSRTKRNRLYTVAKEHSYNVLALGQHLDDLTEGFLMSVFHNGKLRTMKAHYYIRERDLRVIRPFVYVREKALRQFAECKKLPVVQETCETCDDAPKKLERNKALIAQQELVYPRLYWSLRSALQPLIVARGFTNDETNQLQKRHRRPRTNSFTASASSSSQPLNDSETEEEPVV